MKFSSPAGLISQQSSLGLSWFWEHSERPSERLAVCVQQSCGSDEPVNDVGEFPHDDLAELPEAVPDSPHWRRRCIDLVAEATGGQA